MDLFNALDFNNHILYVHKSSQNQSRSTSAVNPNTGVVSIGYNGMGDLSSFSFKPELVQFLENASFFQNVVEEINDTLSLIL